MFGIVFSFNVKRTNISPCLHYIRLSYNIKKCFSALSECTCLHKTVNMVIFFIKSNENIYPKGRALVQMYRVVPITKRENIQQSILNLIGLLFCLFEDLYLI